MTDSSSSSPDLPLPDPSLPPASATSEPPRSFTLSLSNDEFVRVALTAVRHSPGPIGSYVCTVEFGDTSNTWFFEEQNVASWFWTQADEEQPTSGSLDVPVYFLEAVREMLTDDNVDNVDFFVDRDANTISLKSKQCTFTATLPTQKIRAPRVERRRSSRLHVHVEHFAQIGSFLTAVPVDLPEDEDGHPAVFQPFITFSYDGTDLVVTRDWTRFDGPVLTMRVPAGGSYRGTFSMYAPVVAREIYLSDIHGSGALVFEFFDDEPHLCKVGNTSWGFNVQLANEHVFKYRRRLESLLSGGDAELEVTRDSYFAWDPVVVVKAGSRSVTATITPDEKGEAKFIRLNTDIVSDFSWSTELATEINAWNNQWPAVKLVFTDGVLHAVADVPIGAVAGISESVVNLVAKAQIVDELIAAVL
jgi:hypothetical protein